MVARAPVVAVGMAVTDSQEMKDSNLPKVVAKPSMEKQSVQKKNNVQIIPSRNTSRVRSHLPKLSNAPDSIENQQYNQWVQSSPQSQEESKISISTAALKSPTAEMTKNVQSDVVADEFARWSSAK